MSKMTIMQGLPASGKSTKAKEIALVGNTIRVNKDLLRTMLHFDRFTGRNEGITRDMARAIVKGALEADMNVIIDDTNLNPGTVQSWKDLAKEHEAKIEYEKCFDVSVEECVARDAKREKKVGAHVIQKMALQYLDYLKGKKVIVCDLDGTLCNVDHRLRFTQSEPKDWKGFFGAISEDTLRPDVNDKINSILSSGEEVYLIFVSARPDNYREVTEKWLKDNYYYNYTALIMRESHDKRPDVEVKGDIYERYLKKLNIIKVFDDRPSVIRMWREKGLDVEDVGKGIEF